VENLSAQKQQQQPRDLSRDRSSARLNSDDADFWGYGATLKTSQVSCDMKITPVWQCYYP